MKEFIFRHPGANRGPEVFENMIPYSRQYIDDDDIQAVVEVLRSDWLTTGPKVGEFEGQFADFTGSRYAVAVSNGTAALHAAVYAAAIGPGDEVIVPSITFAATANAVVFQGGTPVFADVDTDTLLMGPDDVKAKITEKTKAVIAVDYAGQPCDYDRLRTLCNSRGLLLLDDACHALGGHYHNRPVGSLADLNTFSLHPAKNMTTGEGGVITTDNAAFAESMRVFRNHGITSTHREREAGSTWFYEMVSLGYNYRLTDLQCALGISQLKKLPRFISRRKEIAAQYDKSFAGTEGIKPLSLLPHVSHAYHLYVIRLKNVNPSLDRATLFRLLRERGIGVNVHYVPVHLHPFYKERFNTGAGMCPVAEEAYKEILSIPIHPAMTDTDVDTVVSAVQAILTDHQGTGGE